VRGLEQHAVARDQRGGDLAGREHDRVVVGHDPGDDADRLRHGVVHGSLRRRDGLPGQRVRGVGEEVQHGGTGDGVRAGEPDDVAAVEGVQGSQLVGVRADPVRDLPHDGDPLGQRRGGPGGEGCAAGLHGGVDVRGVGVRHGGDDLTERWGWHVSLLTVESRGVVAARRRVPGGGAASALDEVDLPRLRRATGHAGAPDRDAA
jgi:hypothetical protein